MASTSSPGSQPPASLTSSEAGTTVTEARSSATGNRENGNGPHMNIDLLLQNDPKRTGFDPQMAWWVNLFHIMQGKVSDEGKYHYREWRSKVHEERDCKNCEEWRAYLFKYSPVITFMRGKISALNGRLDESNVRCVRCPARVTESGQVVRRGGGFSPWHGIEVCANEIRDRSHLEDTIAHEMVHAYDILRWKADLVGDKDLRQAACSEVRVPLPEEYGQTRMFYTIVLLGLSKTSKRFAISTR